MRKIGIPITIAFILLSFILVQPLPVKAEPLYKQGDVVFAPDFDKEADRAAWSSRPAAAWIRENSLNRTVLQVSVSPQNSDDFNTIEMPFDLAPFRGMRLAFTCRARAENVTQPAQPYLGVKYMLYFDSAQGQRWINQNDVYGTFDWRELSFIVGIPDDPSKSRLYLGLQGSSGRVLFDQVRVIVVTPRRPGPAVRDNDAPAWTGHEVPRLRGVMSPASFRDEDLRVLGQEWRANLIRWQLVRDWGKPGTDRDPAEYDRWIDLKCDELELVLDAARRYGSKVVIDLHSPPGGRYQDNNVAMFYEKTYNDQFVRVWEKIARRFRGRPALWAFDLVNEPVHTRLCPAGLDSLSTQERAARAIRRIDPDTTVIVEAEDWDSPQAFRYLLPIDVTRVVYQAHMYWPHEFTHQGVYGPGPEVRYPGQIAGKAVDKEMLREYLKPVRDFELAYNVHIYIGEFSAIRWAPGAETYLRDCIDIFEEYGWDWSYHAFREWDGWSVEHEGPMNGTRAVDTTPRKELLLGWFAKNRKP
jgi:endoglucanase